MLSSFASLRDRGPGGPPAFYSFTGGPERLVAAPSPLPARNEVLYGELLARITGEKVDDRLRSIDERQLMEGPLLYRKEPPCETYCHVRVMRADEDHGAIPGVLDELSFERGPGKRIEIGVRFVEHVEFRFSGKVIAIPSFCFMPREKVCVCRLKTWRSGKSVPAIDVNVSR